MRLEPSAMSTADNKFEQIVGAAKTAAETIAVTASLWQSVAGPLPEPPEMPDRTATVAELHLA